MKKKKNRFWLFILSLCPGAGHMYMGFMRMGLSFMAGFMLMIAVIGITGFGVLSVFPVTLYIYSFFHANNIGAMDDESFAALDDEYLFGFGDLEHVRFKLDRKNRNLAAVVLIVLGVYMLWDVGFGILRDYIGWDNTFIRDIYYTMRNGVPRIVIAIAIIWFGVSLLRGKKADSAEPRIERREETEKTGREQSVQGQTEQGETVQEQEEPVRWTGQVEQIEQKDAQRGE